MRNRPRKSSTRVTLVLLGAFLAVYLAVTPYNELTLIREGNAAAAISLGGAITGYVLLNAAAMTS